MNGPEYVFVGQEVIKAQVLDRSPKSPHGTGISAELGLGVRDANLHGLEFRAGWFPVPRVRGTAPTAVIVG
jgi:hypothetical protein